MSEDKCRPVEDEDADEYLPIDDDPDWRAVETVPVGDVL